MRSSLARSMHLRDAVSGAFYPARAPPPLRRNSRAHWYAYCSFEAGEHLKGGCTMLYQSFQAMVDAGQPARQLAGVLSEAMWRGWRGAPLYPASKLAALFELLALAVLTHSRPAFGIDRVEVAGET